MIRLLNDTTSLLSYDKRFIILKGNIKDSKEEYYIVYNSVRHTAMRLTKIEFSLLELLYKYEDIEFIVSKFETKNKSLVSNALSKLVSTKLLSLEVEVPTINTQNEKLVPSTYYLHLTDKCNLNCTYCYNKKQRINYNDLPIDKWKKIVDKISPFAKSITLTGGECLLYHDFSEILDYIRFINPKLHIACISNGMHDFEQLAKKCKFEQLNHIMFSCDSISKVGNRIGFIPKKFKTSVEFIKNNYPSVSVEISTTLTAYNDNDLSEIRTYCNSLNCYAKFINLVPEQLSDIEDMPRLQSCLDAIETIPPNNSELRPLPVRGSRCGASRTVCSIDSQGYVYPCQALHYKEFLMGNILDTELVNLRYIKDDKWCLPDVDELEGCSECEIRYICGGGCLAVTYAANNRMFKRSRLMCPFKYNVAISHLINIKTSSTN